MVLTTELACGIMLLKIEISSQTRFTMYGKTLFIQARFTMYGTETLFIQIRFTMYGTETLFNNPREDARGFDFER